MQGFLVPSLPKQHLPQLFDATLLLLLDTSSSSKMPGPTSLPPLCPRALTLPAAAVLTALTAPPPALTSAELAELSISTPNTFEGIPPLLRHLEAEVEFTIEPAFQGATGGKGGLWITEG